MKRCCFLDIFAKFQKKIGTRNNIKQRYNIKRSYSECPFSKLLDGADRDKNNRLESFEILGFGGLLSIHMNCFFLHIQRYFVQNLIKLTNLKHD